MSKEEIVEKKPAEVTAEQLIDLKFKKAADELAEFAKINEQTVFDYEDKKGNKDARSHIRKLRSVNAGIEAARKEAKADALEYGRKVDKKAGEYKEVVADMINVHLVPIKAIEEREAIRKEKLSKCVLTDFSPLNGSAVLKVKHNDLYAIESDGDEEVEANKVASLAALDAMIIEAKRIEDEQAELERLRKEKIQREEEAARQAEIDRKAKEQAAREIENARLKQELAEKQAKEEKQRAKEAEERAKEAEEREKKREEERIAQREQSATTVGKVDQPLTVTQPDLKLFDVPETAVPKDDFLASKELENRDSIGSVFAQGVISEGEMSTEVEFQVDLSGDNQMETIDRAVEVGRSTVQELDDSTAMLEELNAAAIDAIALLEKIGCAKHPKIKRLKELTEGVTEALNK